MERLIGLDSYVAKYGRHLTVDLAVDVCISRWSVNQVVESSQSKVYYNVTRASIGDMVYLVNMVYANEGWPRSRCVDYMLSIVGNYKEGRCYAFNHFMYSLQLGSIGFDFSKYI